MEAKGGRLPARLAVGAGHLHLELRGGDRGDRAARRRRRLRRLHLGRLAADGEQLAQPDVLRRLARGAQLPGVLLGDDGEVVLLALAHLVDVAQVDDAALRAVARRLLRAEVVQAVLHVEHVSNLLLARLEHKPAVLPHLLPRDALGHFLEPLGVQRRHDRVLLAAPLREGRELRLEHAEPRLHVAAVDRPHARRLRHADEVDAEVVEVDPLGALDALELVEHDRQHHLLLARLVVAEDAQLALRVEREPVRLPRAVALLRLVLEIGPALLEDDDALLLLLPLLALLDVAEHHRERAHPRAHLVLRLGGERPRAAGRRDLEAVPLGARLGDDALGDGEVDGALALRARLRLEIEQPVRGEEHAEAPLEGGVGGLAPLVEPAALDFGHVEVREQLVELAAPRVEDGRVLGAQRVRLRRRLDLEEAAAVGRVDEAYLVREAHVDVRVVRGRLRLLERELAVRVETEVELLPHEVGAHLHVHQKIKSLLLTRRKYRTR